MKGLHAAAMIALCLLSVGRAAADLPGSPVFADDFDVPPRSLSRTGARLRGRGTKRIALSFLRGTA